MENKTTPTNWIGRGGGMGLERLLRDGYRCSQRDPGELGRKARHVFQPSKISWVRVPSPALFAESPSYQARNGRNDGVLYSQVQQ